MLAAPDATMLTAQVSSGGSATIVMSHRDGALVFTAAGLPGLAPPRAYQLWLMSPSGAAVSRAAARLPGTAWPARWSSPGWPAATRSGSRSSPPAAQPRPTTAPILMLSLS